MWDNPRLLNILAGALVGVATLVFALIGVQAMLRSPLFPVKVLAVKTVPQKTTRAELEEAAAGRTGANFFAVDLAELRAALERLPWVRRVELRRVWPDTIEVALEEHVALARWGDEALVNSHGEKFLGRTDEKLPLFLAPEGMAGEVTRRYASFGALVAPLGTTIERVVLSPRHAWELRLASGLDIVLGRGAEAAEERLRRFVAVYDATLKTMNRRHEHVDLRYPNGFALRIPELKG